MGLWQLIFGKSKKTLLREKRERQKQLNETKHYLQKLQDVEDRAMETDAAREAYDMFQQWLIGTPIIIAKPVRCTILVYTTPKYDSAGYNKLRDDYFTELKRKYEQYGNNPPGSQQRGEHNRLR